MEMQPPIQILTAHALPGATAALRQAISREGDLLLAGACHTWPQAVSLAGELRPDVLTLDVALPGLPGTRAIGELVARLRQRVVVTAAAGCGFTTDIVACLEAGVVDFASRRTEHLWNSPAFLGALLERVRQAVRVPRESLLPPQVPAVSDVLGAHPMDVWLALGDVGAAGTLARLVPHLSPEACPPLCLGLSLPAPITRALAHYLDARSAVRVQEAREGDLLLPGRVLVLPGNCIASLRPSRTGRPCIHLDPRQPGATGPLPLDRTAAAFAAHTTTHLVALSGAGPDGVRAAESIRAAGGRVYAAAPECSVLPGLVDGITEAGLCDGRLRAWVPPAVERPMVAAAAAA